VLLDVLISSASGRTLSAALMGFRFDFPGAAAAVAARNRETLLISGAGDRFVGAGDMEVFADLVGPHELAIVRDAGHWPMIEQPRAVIHILKSWLTEPADREDL
jgi:pimeloyl-ACP methyl ester carboxylesterase